MYNKNVGDSMKKILNIFVIIILSFLLIACENNSNEEKFQVIFETNGGSPIPEVQLLPLDSKIDLPSVEPVKAGYKFDGWFLDRLLTEPWVSNEYLVKGHTKIYASWAEEAVYYTVTFLTDGGTPEIEEQSVIYGGKVAIPKAITKPDHKFLGWYKDIENDVKFNFLNDVVTEDITLYAKWEKVFTAYRNMRFSEDSFTIAILPDTQIYTDVGKVPNGEDIYNSQVEYIVRQSEKENILFTAHLGDIVDRANNLMMWRIANNAMKILDDANIPYGVTAGNHDFPGLTNDGRFFVYNDDERTGQQNYLTYFPKSRTQTPAENYGGHSQNGWNSYYYFMAGEQKYMVLFLDYHPSENTLNWAHTIMQQNMNVPTILISHILIRYGSTPSNGYFQYNETKALYNNFISKYDQFIVGISGHYTGQGYAIMKNDFGNDMLFIQVDYQGNYNGGNGVMNLLEFDTSNNQLHLHSFSPWVMMMPQNERNVRFDIEVLTDTRNKYSIDFNFEERYASFINN